VRKRLLLIFILAALIITIPFANIGMVSSSTVGWIEGTVTDPLTGSPIVGANVTANGYTNTTDVNGNYTIQVDAGTYNVTASAEGYWDSVATNINVTADSTVIINFDLSRTVISVEPPTITEKVGATFTVNITITDVFNLYFWEFHMSFNKSVLTVTSVTEGPFLSDVDSTSWNMMPPDFDTPGIVKAANLLWYYPPEGATGNGTLCTITFQVKDVGNTSLHFYYTVLATYDEGLLSIAHAAEDGSVMATLPGDVDGDGDVDIYDLALFSRAYGTSVGEPGFNRLADLDSDGDVDLDDLNLYAENYGKTV